MGPTQQVDKQEFLMLLVAQLRNQDPTKPMEDREFISQLAQFNTLEQMQAMNQTLTTTSEMTVLGQLASFVGKHVTAMSPDGGTIDGVVSGVTLLDGSPILTVGSNQVDIRSVFSITDAAGAPTAPDPTPASTTQPTQTATTPPATTTDEPAADQKPQPVG
jgi:flagellar basal-body rod modification protein FlgD